MTVVIDASFVTRLDAHFSTFPKVLASTFPIALNEAARYARKVGVQKIMQDTAFPSGYLDRPGRFEITQFATAERPEAVLKARGRATLLYEFAPDHPTPEATRGIGVKGWRGISTADRVKGQRAHGVTVIVKPGTPRTIPEAFVVPLKSGAMAIAVKLKNGVFPAGLSKKNIDAKQLGGDYYILYGPSVDQVFRDVAQKIETEVTSYMSTEFRRLFFVELGKR